MSSCSVPLARPWACPSVGCRGCEITLGEDSITVQPNGKALAKRRRTDRREAKKATDTAPYFRSRVEIIKGRH